METSPQYSNSIDFFVYNRIFLKCAGLWAPENQTTILSYLYKSYATFIFLFVNVYFTFTEFVSLMQTYRNLHDVIKNINFALTHLMGAIKCIFWFFVGHRLIHIMQTLQSGEYLYYEDEKSFKPRVILQSYKRKGAIYTITFLCLAHMTLTSSYVPALAAAAFFKEEHNNTFSQKLPYFSWMPFAYDTPSKYIIALGYQAVPMFSYAYSIVGMDTLYMNIMNCMVAHLLIIHGAFRTLRPRCLKRIAGKELSDDGLMDSSELSKEMMKEMKRIIGHLQTTFK